MEKKFKIDFENGCAIENYITPKGNVIIRRFKLFIDAKGIYISKRFGFEYMTTDNCEVI